MDSPSAFDKRSDQATRSAAPRYFTMRLRYWIWLISYAAIVALVVLLLLHLRNSTIMTLNTPQAQQEWEQWRTAARERSGDEGPVQGPVKRKVPRTREPPALVLMRDYFAVTLVGALFFSTMLFLFTVFVSHGIMPAGDSRIAKGDDIIKR